MAQQEGRRVTIGCLRETVLSNLVRFAKARCLHHVEACTSPTLPGPTGVTADGLDEPASGMSALLVPMRLICLHAARNAQQRVVGLAFLLGLAAGCHRPSATVELVPQSRVNRCPDAGIDTHSWLESRSESLGVVFRHPAGYAQKVWAYDSGSVQQEWRRDGRSTRSFRIGIASMPDPDLPSDEQRAQQSFPGASNYSACIDDDSGRRAVVRIFTSGSAEENGVPFVPHAVSATWRLAGRRQLRFESIGADSADQRIHLAVVHSVRFLVPLEAHQP